ncbi:MAG: shikimate kinase [Gemmatimonadota bacterium]
MIERVVLLGFMAAGKTTVGGLLADRLDWEFVDLDELITLRTGQSVEAIFRHGEHAFRAEEAAATADVAARRRMVLAPGAGWITNAELPAALGDGTVYVWLRVDAETAVLRARRETAVRPMLAEGDPEETAQRLLAAREPLYAAHADLAVDAVGRTSEDITREIEAWLAERIGAPVDNYNGQA